MQIIAVIFFSLSLVLPSALSASQSAAQKPASQPKQTTGQPNAEQKTAEQTMAEPGATSTSKLALPFKRAWQRLTEDAITLAPTLDNARIYLPLAGGRVFCLDRETGALLWSSEPGGIISAPAAA